MQYFSVSGAATLKGAATEAKPAVAGYAVEAATAAFAPIAPGFSLWAQLRSIGTQCPYKQMNTRHGHNSSD